MSHQELEKRVSESLEKIRPYLEADGGDISLVKVTDDFRALVQLHGTCTNCSMSVTTMKAGVEGAIRSAVPEILSVEAVKVL